MSAESESQLTHADRHDLDKLSRWRDDLAKADSALDSGFQACAIFLVTEQATASHDIFRRYRTTFESLGAGFHNLVIFGQHGASTTQAAMLQRLGLNDDSAPLLAITALNGMDGRAICIGLPAAERGRGLEETGEWADALQALQAQASRQEGLALDGLAAGSVIIMGSSTLLDTVEGLLCELSPGGNA